MSATQRPQEQRTPGQMTVQMRTVEPSNRERVLRVALVREGRVLDEQTFDEPDRVTLGPALGDTFLVEDAAIPASITLIERSRGGLVLRPCQAMRGRVSQLDSTVDLTHVEGGLTLHGMARGKLTIGATTILFAFEQPHVRAVSPQPDAIRTNLQIDWQLTVIAAFSFLMHFGVIGGIYSDWQDPVLSDESRVASLIEAVRRLPAPTEEEKPTEQVSETEEAKTAEVKTASSQTTTSTPVKNASVQQRAGAAGATSRQKARRESINAALENFDVQMTTVLNRRGTSTDRVLQPDAKLQQDLDDAARSSSRNAKHGQLDTTTSNGTEIEGTTSMRQHGDPSVDTATNGGVERKKKGPKVDDSVTQDKPTPTPEIPDAQSVIGALQASFRRCYQAGLSRESDTMEGSVRITLKVGPNGSVTAATPSAVTGTLTPTVIGCMVSRASTAQFSAPKNGAGAVLVVPISLRAQKK